MTGDMQKPGLEESDERLVQRASHGDGSAFDQLIDRHSQTLFRTAFAMLGERMLAEDVVQETLLAAFRGLGGFRHQSSFRTWLIGILIRQARLAKRRLRPTFGIETASEVKGRAPPNDAAMDVQQALALLSDEHREVLILREFDQLSYDEMAAALQLPRGTIESRLYRARLEMKQRLRGYSEG